MLTPSDKQLAAPWRATASRVYRMGLSLYPKAFRERFGAEMHETFLEALDECAHQGTWNTLQLMGREIIETPGSILEQHLARKSFWTKPYPINLLAFTLGFLLLGLIDTGINAMVLDGSSGYSIYLLSVLAVGGCGGLAIGAALNAPKKPHFAICGAAGFLLAHTLVQQMFFHFFPNAFLAPGTGISFVIPFLYPFLQGSVFGLLIGFATRNLHATLRFVTAGGLALLAGFFVRRLSAALVQSFMFHSPTQDIVQTGTAGLLFFIVIPCLLEGALLGMIFGKTSQMHAVTQI